MSATPIADRCIKLSTHHAIHIQSLAVEWPYWKAQWLPTWHCHRMPPFQQVRQISAMLELPRSTLSAVIVKWKRLGATAQPQSGRPHKLTEWDWRVLKSVACENRLSSVATLTSEFQTISGRNVSTRTVWRFTKWVSMAENITMRNVLRRPVWCKARRHWTLEQWKCVLWSDESRFTI